MSARAADLLNKTRATLWLWGFFLFIYVFIMAFWGVTASNFKYTFSDVPYGTLKNERWSPDFVFTGSLLLYFMIPFTLGFALDSPFREWRRRLHVIATVVAFIYGVIVVGFWGYYYQHANEPSADNAGNPANDERWCNLYFNLPGSGCPETQPIVGLVPSMLLVRSVFLWKFWFFAVLEIMLILNFVLTVFLLEPAVRAFRMSDDIDIDGDDDDEDAKSARSKQRPLLGPSGGGDQQQQQQQQQTVVYQSAAAHIGSGHVFGPIPTRIGGSRPH